MNGDMPFAGRGHNPESPDLPLGFGMKLAQEPRAMEAFGRMSVGEKAALIARVQSGKTGEDARRLIAEAIDSLKTGYNM